MVVVVCAKGNPTNLELLFAPPAKLLYASPLWQQLAAAGPLRRTLLTQRAAKQYVGHAAERLHRVDKALLAAASTDDADDDNDDGGHGEGGGMAAAQLPALRKLLYQAYHKVRSVQHYMTLYSTLRRSFYYGDMHPLSTKIAPCVFLFWLGHRKLFELRRVACGLEPHVSLRGGEKDLVLGLRATSDHVVLVQAAARATEMLAAAREALEEVAAAAENAAVEGGATTCSGGGAPAAGGAAAAAAEAMKAELAARERAEGADHCWFGGRGAAVARLPAEVDMELLARWVANARLASIAS
eukprot:SAG22_NODE_1620_length_3963_cov_3.481884_2_plen_298_part_00